MKNILQKTVLVSAVGLVTMTTHKAIAADTIKDNSVASKLSSKSSSTSSSSTISENSSTSSSVTSSSMEKEVDKKQVTSSESVLNNETILKQNTEMGPGYYTVAKSRMLMSSSTDTQSFIDGIRSGAIAGWSKYGVLPSVSGAQAILESGWGQSLLSTQANNLFGIKGDYNGQSVLMPTQEYYNGHWITVNAQFRKYPTWNESIEDHGRFLAVNSRYSNLLRKSNYKEVTSLLQSDGYATSPTYAASLNRIIEEYHLYDWDNSVINVNVADLNSAVVSGDTLQVYGWHATTNATNEKNSFLFLLDADSKAEVKRYRIQRKNRQDVKNAYPNVAGALNSGFNEKIPLTADMYGRSFVLMSRYASDYNGNSGITDYLFNRVINVPNVMAACLDNLSIKNNKIKIKGWHATSSSRNAKNSYLILMNTATNQEYKRYKISRVTRMDVAAAYPKILNAGKSGFEVEIPVTRDMQGKSFKVLSRYATQDNGEGSLSDVIFNKVITMPKQKNENKADLDEGWVDGSHVHVKGWHAIDDIANKPYHTLIFMDAATNREVHRTSVKNIQRPDVNHVYPNIANSLNSGYSMDVNVTSKMKNKTLYVISRYSKDRTADSQYLDVQLGHKIKPVINKTRNSNNGHLDIQKNSGHTLKLKGWHTSNDSKGKQYHYLILMNRKTNTEIKRVKVANTKRIDVQKAYPNVYNSLNSGFSTTINVTNDLKGKQVYVLSRYTNDPAGNLNTIDYCYGQTTLIK
ncbi:glycoside hydrolase family 73 protein [Latilactobacillus graminis]|uniref:Mannosyl-glycoprotein endo-beta-N-acetylglucosamidase-like domain-containing protein n=2 Tax=Latilactobacillus graminis TaxID=60519 RepID=A0AA89KW71_9LACO|nr:glycoside hydrolase family 73 protein [Latilactobacillus graminis]KRM20953.1 hypothetical protein FC90_GL001485 [Latilactobacillus graminis DSM 20719]QFP79094.1 hypothetical protein LG542_02110 [Latilactobacillus graminis]